MKVSVEEARRIAVRAQVLDGSATAGLKRAVPPRSRQCSVIPASVNTPRARTACSAKVLSTSSAGGTGASSCARGITRSARS